jgi:lipopolysaccharide export system permease protein
VFVQRVERVPVKGPDGVDTTATSERVSVITARSGRQETDAATGTRRLVLRDGRRYTGVPGETSFSVIEFAEHGVVIDVADPNLVSDDRRLRPTQDLIAEGTPKALAEINWRIGVPISALVFALLALPLSRANPREGRFARLFAAILVYVIYSNLLGVARLWLDRGKLAPEVGLWPVHLLFVGLALALLVRQNGWRTLFDDLAGKRIARPAAA